MSYFTSSTYSGGTLQSEDSIMNMLKESHSSD